MIAALFLLLPLVALAVWLFFRLVPVHANRKALRWFNALSLAVAVLLAVAWSVRTYLVMSPTVDSAWWPVISMLGALVIVPVALALAAIARNFMVFRHRRDARSE